MHLLKDSALFQRWTQDELANLKKYKYTSPGSTKLDDFLNKYWWTPLSTIVPANIHPNTLTVVALMFSFGVAYWPQQLLSPNSDRACPRIVYLLGAISYFVYQSLDAVDGKQARRTGLSSPLGQMMDHGCDAMTTYFSVFLIASTMQIPLSSGAAIATILTSITFQLIYYGWYELRHGVYKTNTGGVVGVTEGQYTVIILCLISFISPSFWQHTLGSLTGLGRLIDFFTFGLKINQLVFWPCAVAMTYINTEELKYVTELVQGTKKPLLAETWKKNVQLDTVVKDMIEIAFHLYVQAALCLSGVLARHPLPVVTSICVFGAQMVWRFLVASLLDAPLVAFDRANIPYYAISLILSTSALQYAPFMEGLACWTLSFYAIAVSFGYAWAHLDQMKTYLNVPLFIVPPANRQAATQTPAPTPAATPASPTPAAAAPASPTPAAAAPAAPTPAAAAAPTPADIDATVTAASAAETNEGLKDRS